MLTPNFIDCRSIFRWIYLELVVCVWRDKLQKSTDWLLAVVNRFPTWYFTAFFEWLGNLQFTGINIYFKSVLIFRDLSFCLWFFCQSIAQITVLKDNLQQCLYELMKMKKKFIIHTSYSPAWSPSLCNGFYNVFRKIWQFDFFLYFKCVNIWTKSTHFQKENPLFVLLITLFSNRYCLMSCQYAGDVLILQTVF